MRQPAEPGHRVGAAQGEERGFGTSPPSIRRFSLSPAVYPVLAVELSQAGDRFIRPSHFPQDSWSGGGRVRQRDPIQNKVCFKGATRTLWMIRASP